MGDEEGRFLLCGEDQAFKEKASSLFSALSGVHYSPTQDVDGFLKSDPLKDGSQPPSRDGRGVGRAEDRSRDVAGSRRLPRDGGSQLMPPPNRPVWKRKRGNVPDHFANPSKYTKYSLDDVPEQQMSQKSNTAAALSFLREIDEKKRQEEAKEEEEAAADKRPLFKKPKNKSKPNTSEDTSSSTNTPDSEPPTRTDSYQTTPKSKQKKKASKGKEIKLSHLEEYEDDG